MTGSDPLLQPSPAGALSQNYADNHQNLEPVKIATITDGTSTTLMWGEKYHVDDFFDTWTTANSGMKMYQVSGWAWAGGVKGTAALFCSGAIQINSTTKSLGATSPDINVQDQRYNAWGSGHMGGACFAFCDSSVRFIQDSIDLTTLGRLSTRAGDETIDNTNY